MKLNQKAKWIAIMLCSIMLIAMLPATAMAASAIDTTRDTSLTVTSRYDGQPLEGVPFDVYRVATVDAYAKFTAAPAFAGYSITLENNTLSSWQQLAETLSGFARADGITPDAQGSTDANGEVKFSSLPVGLYLVYGGIYEDENLIYTPEPFMVCLPDLDENDEWVYDAKAKVKGSGVAITEIKVLKVWDDEGAEDVRPEEITVQLLKDDEVYETVVLNQENNWGHTWKRLDPSSKWHVVEKDVPKGYTLQTGRDGITFILTNTYAPEVTQISVEKVWKDSGYSHLRPSSVTIKLYCDGKLHDTVELNSSNAWKCKWQNLEAGHKWTVEEGQVPNGYIAKVTQDGEKFTVTNTYKPLWPTGQLWWPIPVLVGAGLLCLVVWLLIRKRDEAREEA